MSMADTLTLQRFEPFGGFYEEAPELEKLRGVFADVETTGLDPKEDSIIQLALVPFTFTREGAICDVGPAFVELEEPAIPISDAIAKLTGITDELVAGKRIDDAAVERIAGGAALVVAHHAEFDRQFIEERFPVFSGLRWGCSMADVPWQDEGFTSTKLEWLAFKHCGLFYDSHQADVDAFMAIHLLSTKLPSGRRVMDCVLDAARQQWVRVWAVGADFQKRHVLKQRGYHWDDGTNGRPKAWWIDVKSADLAEEREWLGAAAGGAHLQVDRFDARQRFSDRVGRR